jgi:hypothetical protein
MQYAFKNFCTQGWRAINNIARKAFIVSGKNHNPNPVKLSSQKIVRQQEGHGT